MRHRSSIAEQRGGKVKDLLIAIAFEIPGVEDNKVRPFAARVGESVTSFVF